MSERLTREQAAIIGAFTGVLLGDFPTLHAYIEKLLGRPVLTHELASKELWAAIKERAEVEYRAIAPEPAA